jgi:branched-subunit amino acid aminotransferase/4-amino-4-deoxychorismate lyase
MVYDLIDGQFIKQGERIFGTEIPEQLLFTDSVRAIRNQLMFWNEHLALINLQLQLLNQELPVFMKNEAKELKRQIERTLVKNKLFKSARIDLHLYTNNQTISYLIRTKAIDSASYELNYEGIVLEPFKKTFKADSPLCALRMGSEPYWKILKAFQSSSFTEPILENAKGCLLEAPERNLYLIQGMNIHTTAPGSGVYIDPSRDAISKVCEQAGFSFHEDEFLDEDDLLQADEVFLAGDLYGIQWVKGIGMKRYLNKKIRKLNEFLNSELLKY